MAFSPSRGWYVWMTTWPSSPPDRQYVQMSNLTYIRIIRGPIVTPSGNILIDRYLCQQFGIAETMHLQIIILSCVHFMTCHLVIDLNELPCWYAMCNDIVCKEAIPIAFYSFRCWSLEISCWFKGGQNYLGLWTKCSGMCPTTPPLETYLIVIGSWEAPRQHLPRSESEPYY